jgi:hypothetical protein
MRNISRIFFTMSACIRDSLYLGVKNNMEVIASTELAATSASFRIFLDSDSSPG